MAQHPRLFRSLKALSAGLVIVLAAACSLNVTYDDTALTILAVVSGSSQTVPINSTSADPLVVRAFDGAAVPIKGVVVSWVVTGGGGSVSSASTTTDSTGTTSVIYTPGPPTGLATIRATAGTLSVTFTETLIPAA